MRATRGWTNDGTVSLFGREMPQRNGLQVREHIYRTYKPLAKLVLTLDGQEYYRFRYVGLTRMGEKKKHFPNTIY